MIETLDTEEEVCLYDASVLPKNQSSGGSMPPRNPQQIIKTERAAYLDDLPEPEPDWPSDVRVVYETLRDQLFETGEIRAKTVVDECGITSHDIYSRFRYFTGHGIKEFAIYHRLELAKRLLRYDWLSVTGIAFAVGYSTPSGFSKTFKRRVGQSPTAFRVQKEG